MEREKENINIYYRDRERRQARKEEQAQLSTTRGNDTNHMCSHRGTVIALRYNTLNKIEPASVLSG